MQNLSLLGQLVASLGGVLGLIWLLARTSQKRGWFSGGTSQVKPIRIVARHGLTKTASLAVVRVGDRELLLGIGTQGVNVLLDQEAGPLLAVTSPSRALARTTSHLPDTQPVMATEGSVAASRFSSSSARTPMLDRLRARTVRH
jgi:flagellar biogenesis protein FliO